jgi:hypothetical protein
MWQANNLVRNHTSTIDLIEVLNTAGRMQRIFAMSTFMAN